MQSVRSKRRNMMLVWAELFISSDLPIAVSMQKSDGRKSSLKILLFMIKKDQENVIDIVKNTHYNVFKFLTIRNAVTGRST